MGSNQRCRGSDEVGVVAGGRSIGQDRDVLQPRPDPMPSNQGTAIDRPACDTVPVVDLIHSNSCSDHDLFHSSGVVDGNCWVEFKRLDEDATTAVGQARSHEGPGIVDREQPRLDLHTAAEEEFAQVHDADFTLIRGHEVG